MNNRGAYNFNTLRIALPCKKRCLPVAKLHLHGYICLAKALFSFAFLFSLPRLLPSAAPLTTSLPTY